MSSQNRGAQGTIKQKGVSVNTLFSGRNLAPGLRGNDPSRNGMQSVGKAGNVVRRMPPPASLPSLRAENNGQDPTTPVVPQVAGGAGWSKSDNPNGAAETPQSPTTQAPPPVPPPPPANDLRPSWLVAANAEQQANNSQAREFPSLAPPLNEPDKICNKWENSSLAEKLHEMSNNENFEGGVPPRFLGSQQPTTDAFNAKAVGKSNSNNSKYNKISDDEGFDSQDRDRNYSTEEGGWSPNGSPSQTDSYGPDKDTESDYRPYMKTSLPQFRTSEIRILKRATEQLLLQDISDDEDEVQMTRLDKPSVCIVKRGGETKPVGNLDSERSEQRLETRPTPLHSKLEKKEKKPKKEGKNLKKEHKDKEKKQTVPPPNPGPTPAPAPVSAETPPAEKPIPVEEILPAPPPQENIWAKRKEERESLEREKEKSLMPRVMQQAIEQHFPMVHESATIKVNKESTRKSSDTEFTRAAIRARKQATSNDVRRLITAENSAKIRMNRLGNQESNGVDHNQSGKTNGFNGQNGQNGAGRTNGKIGGNNNRDRKDSHRSNVSSQHSDDTRKHVNGQSKKKENHHKDEKIKENGDANKFNIEDSRNVNIGSWADEMENDGFEEVSSKKKKNKTAEKSAQQSVKSSQNSHHNNQENEKQAKIKAKDPKHGTRLFVPKALRKEADDLPANGLLSPQSVETKEKIAAAKSVGEIVKKSDNETKGFWESLTPEVSTIPKKVKEPTKKPEGMNVEFPKPSGKSLDITAYDFSFDPQFNSNDPIISDRAAIQQMLSAENAATDDDSNNRRKILNELRQSLDELGPVAVAKISQEYNETFNCRQNTNNISLAPFSNHFSSFQPLYNTDSTQGLLYPTAAPSPPMSYLNMMNFSNSMLKRQNGFGAPDNGLLGRLPTPAAAAAAAAVAAQQQRIWNGPHFDINSLAGTPPANYSSNGSYGFFNSPPTTNEHRSPFGGLPNGLSNGMGNGQTPYFDRTNLPPANLAVGSQRQGNMFNGNPNMNRQPPQQQQSSGPAHPMNGMNNQKVPFPPQSFPQPPPGMMRYPPTNGPPQDNGSFYFNNGSRPGGPIGRPPGLPAPGHSVDMIWSNSNSNYFGNAGHSNGNWNGVQQAAGLPRQNGYNQNVRDNQQMNNRARRAPVNRQ